MERLNLTLDDDTFGALARHAKERGSPRSAVARELIREALQHRAALQYRQRLARDYAAGRDDARELLDEIEDAQLELLDDDARRSAPHART